MLMNADCFQRKDAEAQRISTTDADASQNKPRRFPAKRTGGKSAIVALASNE
jgi:hypothetical protein